MNEEKNTVNQVEEQDFWKGINQWCEENKPLIDVTCTVLTCAATIGFSAMISKGSIGSANKIAQSALRGLNIL